MEEPTNKDLIFLRKVIDTEVYFLTKKIDEQIVAITGATVSSQAVVKMFNRYIDQIKIILKDKGLIVK